MSVIDLVERLTRKVQKLPAMGGGSIGLDANGKTTVTSYITDDGYRLANPDGPEAAGTIIRLQAALENPTPEMIDAGRAALREHTDEEIDVAEIYRAMTQALGGE